MLNLRNCLQSALAEHSQVINSLDKNSDSLDEALYALRKCIDSSGKIIVFGNGGSASDAQHFCGELLGRFKKNRKPLPCMCLSVNAPVITCISNDYSYAEVFSRQLEAIANSEDVVVMFSTSGKSPNVVEAASLAKDMKLTTISFTGVSGGLLEAYSNICIKVPSNSTARIQEAHLFLIHILCEGLDELYS